MKLPHRRLSAFMNSPQLRYWRRLCEHLPWTWVVHAGHSLTVGVVRLFAESVSVIIVISTAALNETKHREEKMSTRESDSPESCDRLQ